MSLRLYIAMPSDVLSKGTIEYEYADAETDTSKGGWEAYTRQDGTTGWRRPKGSGGGGAGKSDKKPEDKTTDDKPDVINLAEDKKEVESDPVAQFSEENVEGGEGKEAAAPGALEAQEGDPAQVSDEDKTPEPTKDTDGSNTLAEPAPKDQSKTLMDQVHNVQDNEVSTAGTGSKPTEFESAKTQEMPASSSPAAQKEPEEAKPTTTPETKPEAETATATKDENTSDDENSLPVVQNYNQNFEAFQNQHKEYESKLKDLDKQEAGLSSHEKKISDLEGKVKHLESDLQKTSARDMSVSNGPAAKASAKASSALDKHSAKKPPSGKKFTEKRQKWTQKKQKLAMKLKQAKAKAAIEVQAHKAAKKKEVSSLRAKVKEAKAAHKKAVSEHKSAKSSIEKERASVQKKQGALKEPKKPSDAHKQLDRTRISQHRKSSKESAARLQEYLDSGKVDEADARNVKSAIEKYQSNARNAAPSAEDLENKKVLDEAMAPHLKEHEGNTAAEAEQQKTDEKNQRAVERAKQLQRAKEIRKEMRRARENRTKNRLLFSKLYTAYSRGAGQGATMGSAMADPYGGAGRLVNTVDYGIQGAFSAGHTLLDNRGPNTDRAEAKATDIVDKRNPENAPKSSENEEGTGENAQKSLTGLYIRL